MPIKNPAQLVDEFKRSGRFDELRKDILHQFQKSDGKSGLLERIDEIVSQRLENDVRLQYMSPEMVNRELMQEIDRYPIVERSISDLHMFGTTSFNMNIRNAVRHILARDRGEHVPEAYTNTPFGESDDDDDSVEMEIDEADPETTTHANAEPNGMDTPQSSPLKAHELRTEEADMEGQDRDTMEVDMEPASPNISAPTEMSTSRTADAALFLEARPQDRHPEPFTAPDREPVSDRTPMEVDIVVVPPDASATTQAPELETAHTETSVSAEAPPRSSTPSQHRLAESAEGQGEVYTPMDVDKQPATPSIDETVEQTTVESVSSSEHQLNDSVTKRPTPIAEEPNSSPSLNKSEDESAPSINSQQTENAVAASSEPAPVQSEDDTQPTDVPHPDAQALSSSREVAESRIQADLIEEPPRPTSENSGPQPSDSPSSRSNEIDPAPPSQEPQSGILAQSNQEPSATASPRQDEDPPTIQNVPEHIPAEAPDETLHAIKQPSPLSTPIDKPGQELTSPSSS